MQKEVCCCQVRRPWTARTHLFSIIFRRSPSVERMNAGDPFIRAIHHRNNERTLCRCRVKDYKTQKNKFILCVLLGYPLLPLRAIECLKHCNRICGSEWCGYNVRGWLGRCRMSDFAHAAASPTIRTAHHLSRYHRHTISPFFFIISIQWNACKGVGRRQCARR